MGRTNRTVLAIIYMAYEIVVLFEVQNEGKPLCGYFFNLDDYGGRVRFYHQL